MRHRGFGRDAVDTVLETLAEQGYLSDERFAEAYARSRVGRGFGPLRIRAELRQRGVTDPLVELVMQRIADRWVEVMRGAHDKKFGNGPVRDRQERLRRARFLEYRGFPVEWVRRFLFDEE